MTKDNQFLIEPIEHVTISTKEIEGSGYIFTIENGFLKKSVTFGLDKEEIKDLISHLNSYLE